MDRIEFLEDVSALDECALQLIELDVPLSFLYASVMNGGRLYSTATFEKSLNE